MSEKEINLTISKNLVKYLELKNKSQAELAEYVGVTQATVSNWCNGLKMPRMSKLDMICEFFGINRSDLMRDEQPETTGYYFDEETAKMAQELFENKDLRVLFSAARTAKAEDLKTTYDMLMALKRKEGYDGDDPA